MLKQVVRPRHILTTPRMLARRLGVRTVVHTGIYNDHESFCMYHPFSHYDKGEQRRRIAAYGINTPDQYESSTYVVRPLRHHGGNGWRTTNDRNDYNPSTEYIAPLFEKAWEYRSLFVYGEPVGHFLKRSATTLPETPTGRVDAPWNHTNGYRFITVSDWENNRLRHTDVIDRLTENEIIRTADIVAVDIMLRRDRQYAVCEFNFCPGLSFDNTVNSVINAIRQHHATGASNAYQD